MRHVLLSGRNKGQPAVVGGKVTAVEVKEGFDPSLQKIRARKIADQTPDFPLATHRGRVLCAAVLRKDVSGVIRFSRGSSAYCRLELLSLQFTGRSLAKKNVTLRVNNFLPVPANRDMTVTSRNSNNTP